MVSSRWDDAEKARKHYDRRAKRYSKKRARTRHHDSRTTLVDDGRLISWRGEASGAIALASNSPLTALQAKNP